MAVRAGHEAPGQRLDMAWIPGGTFRMGSADFYPEERPVHRVTVDGFWMDRHPVTVTEFRRFVSETGYVTVAERPLAAADYPEADPALLIPGSLVFHRTPGPVDLRDYHNWWAYVPGACWHRPEGPGSSCRGRKQHPVTHVAYEDAAAYAAWAGQALPTEAEWEYACRAGADGPYDFGQPDKLSQYAWFADNSDEKTHPVGQKKPNLWGLHDMYGNVSEWCEDVYSPTYYQQSAAVDPHGPPSPGKDVKRVMRGGSWKSSAAMCRATFRQDQRTGDTDACFFTDFCGFRCVRRVSAEDLQQLKANSK